MWCHDKYSSILALAFISLGYQWSGTSLVSHKYFRITPLPKNKTYKLACNRNTKLKRNLRLQVFDDFIFLPTLLGCSIEIFFKNKHNKAKKRAIRAKGFFGANHFCTSRVASLHTAVKQECGKEYGGSGACYECSSENLHFNTYLQPKISQMQA